MTEARLAVKLEPPNEGLAGLTGEPVPLIGGLAGLNREPLLPTKGLAELTGEPVMKAADLTREPLRTAAKPPIKGLAREP